MLLHAARWECNPWSQSRDLFGSCSFPPYMLHSPPKTLLNFSSPLWHHPVDVGKAFFIIVFENCRQDTDEGGHYRCAKLTNAACVCSVCMLRVCVCVLWERQVTSHAHKYAPSFAQIASNFFVDCWHFFHTSSLRGRGCLDNFEPWKMHTSRNCCNVLYILATACGMPAGSMSSGQFVRNLTCNWFEFS